MRKPLRTGNFYWDGDGWRLRRSGASRQFRARRPRRVGTETPLGPVDRIDTAMVGVVVVGLLIVAGCVYALARWLLGG